MDWTGGLLAHSWGNFDGIAEHWYAQPGRHFDLERAKEHACGCAHRQRVRRVEQTPLEYARYPANIVRRKAEEWQGYQQRFPAMLDKKIFLSIDEYAYFGGGFNRGVDLKLALAYGMLFNEMLRHTDFLTMSAHTMGVSTLDYNGTASTLNTTVFCLSSTVSALSVRFRSQFQETRRNRRLSIPSAGISPRQPRAARPIRSTWWQR